jgi:hypothetical protein
MKKRNFLSITAAVFIILIGSAFKTVLNSNGKPGKTGSPGETTCSSCHGSAGNGSIAVNLPIELQGGASYVLGQTYTISVTVSQSACNLFGFGFEALQASGANGGVLTPGTGSQALSITVLGNSRNNIVHVSNGGATANSHTFTFTWQAPSTNVGNITFYTAGLAADGSGSPNSADKTYSTSVVIPAPQTVGIDNQIEIGNGISVFPNPVTEKISLNYSLIKNAQVKAELFNLEGKAIELFNENQPTGNIKKEIEVEKLNLSNGIYFVSLTIDGKKSVTKKIIINK